MAHHTSALQSTAAHNVMTCEPRANTPTPAHLIVTACSKSFVDAVDLLVELASLQTAFLTLDAAIKTTNRRHAGQPCSWDASVHPHTAQGGRMEGRRHA